jgi:hypothetical protein
MKYSLLLIAFLLALGSPAQSQSLHVSEEFVQGAGSFADPEDYRALAVGAENASLRKAVLGQCPKILADPTAYDPELVALCEKQPR